VHFTSARGASADIKDHARAAQWICVEMNSSIWFRISLAMAAGIFLALPAEANLVVNGSFTSVNGATTSFEITSSSLPGWAATPSGNKILDCVGVASGGVVPNTNLCGTTAFGGGLSMYQMPGASPNGGNFVLLDGDSNYETALTQTITGLAIGGKYYLTFYQAAGQQTTYTGSSTDWWKVTFGSQSITSTSMTVAQGGVAAWNMQTMTFTATSTSQVLSFFAVGTAGTPPFLFLDGVDLEAAPEPNTLSLLLVALAGLVAARKRIHGVASQTGVGPPQNGILSMSPPSPVLAPASHPR
jgi:hypothetical protein